MLQVSSSIYQQAGGSRRKSETEMRSIFSVENDSVNVLLLLYYYVAINRKKVFKIVCYIRF